MDDICIDDDDREAVLAVRQYLKKKQQGGNVTELRSELHDTIPEHPGDEGVPPKVGFEPESPKTPREKLKHNAKIVLPHVGLVILSAAYTLMGAAIFHHFEVPYEMALRNETMERVFSLKQSIIAELWQTKDTADKADWEQLAHQRMDSIIEDVFHDYTKNFMTPHDIINGTGPTKWTMSASIFFSWTAITTIGYGHIVPKTTPGRVTLLGFTLIGIPLILVTIADLGRFLSGGILWVHKISRRFYIWFSEKWRKFFHFVCCCCRERFLPKEDKGDANNNTTTRVRIKTKRQQQREDNTSDAGTFEDISEIHTQTPSEDTRARADELEYELGGEDRRISVLFVLVIMIGYTASGAMLLQLWEQWSFFDAFYFCFVTVTTIGFGDIVPMNQSFIWLTLIYIIIGLIITTMCIDLVGSEYIRDIHFYGRHIGRSFLTIGGKVVHLGEVFGYVAFLQRKYGLTADQLEKLAALPEDYLLDCMIHGREPDLNWIGGRPFIPQDIYYFKWIEQPRTLSFVSEKVLASMESLDFPTSKCSTSRTITPREYYQRILMQYCQQQQQEQQQQLIRSGAGGGIGAMGGVGTLMAHLAQQQQQQYLLPQRPSEQSLHHLQQRLPPQRPSEQSMQPEDPFLLMDTTPL